PEKCRSDRASRRNDLAKLRVGWKKTQDLTGHENAPARAGFGQQTAALFRAEAQRLLNQNMLAGCKRFESRAGVLIRGQTDIDGIDFAVVQGVGERAVFADRREVEDAGFETEISANASEIAGKLSLILADHGSEASFGDTHPGTRVSG